MIIKRIMGKGESLADRKRQIPLAAQAGALFIE